MTIQKTIPFFQLCLIAALLLLLNSVAFAWTDGQDASLVLGQSSFLDKFPGTTASQFTSTYSVAIDAAHGKMYVVDGNNHRVLRFSYPIESNQAAELVFGQADFSSNAPGVSRNTFTYPRDVIVDYTGRLWVSDMANARIVWFNEAYAITGNQPNADGVLGQSDFTSSSTSIAQNKFSTPYGMAMTANGTLFVADSGYSRVLRFNNAAQKANGGNADGVLGQPDFVTINTTVDAHTFNSCRGVALINNSLFVADRLNARVLRFDNAASKDNGADADGVLGQPDFTSNTANLTQSGMEKPSRLTSDPYGRLYVSDGLNYNRVVIFDDAVNLGNGADASAVLGHPDFTTSGSGVDASHFDLDSSGAGMFFDGTRNKLFLADTSNNRILQFDDPDEHVKPFPWPMFLPAVTKKQ